MADIGDYIDSFLGYLKVEKISSPVTIYDYNKELQRFSGFLIDDFTPVFNTVLNLASKPFENQYQPPWPLVQVAYSQESYGVLGYYSKPSNSQLRP